MKELTMRTSLEKTISSSDPSRQLDATERDRLSELEPIIQQGMTSFVAVGNALLEISDRRLYRETHATFAEYCAAKWRMSPRHAYRLCESAEIVNALPKSCDQLVTSESQARELSRVEPARRVKVLEAAASQGTLTASTIRAAAEAEAKPCVVARVEVMNPDSTDGWAEDEIQRKDKVLRGESVVANLKRDLHLIEWAEAHGKLIRIDRGHGPWGNPYEMPGDGTRDEVCDLYEKFIPTKKSFATHSPELLGKVLACWCSPQRCHGNSLVEWLTTAQEATA